MTLITVVPTETYASTNGETPHDDLINLACEAFPEYESIITRQPTPSLILPYGYSDDVVLCETREVSNNHYVGITQYSSGHVLIYDSSSIANLAEDSTGSQIVSDIIGYATFRVTSNIGSEYFTLSNVGFILHQNGSGYFTSQGTPGGSSTLNVSNTSNTSTYISYILYFSDHASTSTFSADFSVGISSGKVRAELM